MKKSIVFAVIAITLFSCTKQAKDNFAPQTQSVKGIITGKEAAKIKPFELRDLSAFKKRNQTSLTTATVNLSAVNNGSSITLSFDFGGVIPQYYTLERRYTDPSGNVLTITWTDDTGATSQSSEWMVLFQAITSWSGFVPNYTTSECLPLSSTLVSGTYDFKCWALFPDGSVGASDIVTITIP